MIIVSDTSCLCYLARLNLESVLEAMYGHVIVPPAVAAELLAGVSVHPEIDRVLHVPWLEIRTLQNPPQPSEFLSNIDVGEAEAIRLAEEMNAEYLLIDDAAGRRMARLKNIPIIGLLGVLSEAKDAGLIPLLRPVYEKLADDLGFHASRHVIEAILEEHGE